MDLANGGTLTQFIIAKGSQSEAKGAKLFYEIGIAVAYLHEDLRLAHRNIKSDNILLHNDSPKLLLSGFPIDAWNFDTDQPMLCNTWCGTHQYKCPQLTRANSPYDPYAADVWAVGVVMFQILNGRFPFTAPNNDKKGLLAQQNNSKHLDTVYVREFSSELIKLQEAFFEVNEKKRITMGKAMKNVWFKKYIK